MIDLEFLHKGEFWLSLVYSYGLEEVGNGYVLCCCSC